MTGAAFAPVMRRVGYELHITRAERPARSAKTPILLKEWTDLVARDPEMVSLAFEDDDGTLEQEGLAKWSAPDAGGAEQNVCFDYTGGRIVVKHPGERAIRKMKEIAGALGALVIGDDGERY